MCEGGVGRGVAGEGDDADPVEGPRVDGGGGRAREGVAWRSSARMTRTGSVRWL